MKVKGQLDLQGNELANVTLPSLASFPADATAGRFIFKDKRVMVCVEVSGGIPVWVPLTQEIATYVHTQSVLSSTWVINHNFNSAIAMVQVLDENNLHVIPNEIDCSVENQVTITFGQTMQGKAIIMLGAMDGTAKPDFAYEESFSSSTTWVVNHGLGYNPELRIYINGSEVQPQSITHNSTTQATITFSTAQAGIVKAI